MNCRLPIVLANETDTNDRKTRFTPPETKRVGIVGGGMIGLILALRISQRGHKVTLVESEKELGGLATSSVVGNYFCDTFPHVIRSSDKHLLALLKELDLEKRIIWKNTKTRFYDSFDAYPFNNLIDVLTLPTEGVLKKIRFLISLFYVAWISHGKGLESKTAEDWLKKIAGFGAYETYWKAFLISRVGCHYGKVTAAWVRNAVRRTSASRKFPLIKEKYGYLPGGNGRIIKQLVGKLEKNNVQVKVDTWVNSYEKYKGRYILDTNQRLYEFDNLIVTCCSPHVVKMCKQLTEQEKQVHKRLEHQGLICVKMAVRKSFGDALLTYISDKHICFSALIEMSVFVDFGMKDRQLIYMLQYVEPDDEMFFTKDYVIAESYKHRLMEMYPFFTKDQVLDYEVSKYQNVMALPTPGSVNNLPSLTTSDEDLFIVNSAQIEHFDLSVNASINHAQKSLEKIQHLIESRYCASLVSGTNN